MDHAALKAAFRNVSSYVESQEHYAGLDNKLSALCGPAVAIIGRFSHAVVLRASNRQDYLAARLAVRFAIYSGVLSGVRLLGLTPVPFLVIVKGPLLHAYRLGTGLLFLAAFLFSVVQSMAVHVLFLYTAVAALLWRWHLSRFMGQSAVDLLREREAELRRRSNELGAVTREQGAFERMRSLLQDADLQFQQLPEVDGIYSALGYYLHAVVPESDGVSILLAEAAGGDLAVQYADGRHLHLMNRETRYPQGSGPTGLALSEGRPVVVRDLSRDPFCLRYLPDMYGSALALPLMASKGRMGAVFITRPIVGEVPSDQVWTANVLVSLAALRLQTLKAQESERRLIEGFAKLHDLVAMRARTRDSGDVLTFMADYLVDEFKAQGCLTFRVVGNTFESVGVRHETPEFAASLRDLVPAGWVLQRLSRSPKVLMAGWSALSRPLGSSAGELGPDPVDTVTVPIVRGDRELTAVIMLVYSQQSGRQIRTELVPVLEIFAWFAGVAMHNLDLFNQVVDLAGQLRLLLGRTVDAQESERRRIALDLHDWGVQGLVGPLYRLQVALQLFESSPAEAAKEVEAAIGLLGQSGDELRRIMKGLRPYLIDELGLARGVDAYVREWGMTYPIDAEVVIDQDFRIPRGHPLAIVAFRIIQEALNNVARHSQASQVRVTVRTSVDQLLLEIEDDGRGFEEKSGMERGLGLAGMRERAGAAGGTLTVSSSPGGGCRVLGKIPISQ